MKILITCLLFINLATGQNSFFLPDGTNLNSEKKSITDIKEEYFSDVLFTDLFIGPDKSCEGYQIMFQKYTNKVLLITGSFPKAKKLNKCVNTYNQIKPFVNDLEKDLDYMIEYKFNKEEIINVFGSPYSKTIDNDGEYKFKIFNYNKYYGAVKFDLIFNENQLVRYIID